MSIKVLDKKYLCVNINYVDGVCRQAVKTSDCGSDMHGFESHQTPHLKKARSKASFFVSDEGENPSEVRARGGRGRRLADQMAKPLQAATEDPFNAAE